MWRWAAPGGRDGGQAFNLVHVYEHTIVHSVVPLGSTPTVGELVTADEDPAAAGGRRHPDSAEGKARGPARTPGPTQSDPDDPRWASWQRSQPYFSQGALMG